MIATPCIGVCSTAVGDNVCFGCARTFDEVSHWLAYSDAERDAVVALLPRRKVWLQIAMQTGGGLLEIAGQPPEAVLALTDNFHVMMGWPQLLQGRAHVPLRLPEGAVAMLPVYRDDWLQCFWDWLFTGRLA